MNRYKKIEWTAWIKAFCNSYLPTKQDNLKQLVIKIGFILALIGVLVSGVYFGSFYYGEARDRLALNADRRIFSENSAAIANNKLHSKNYDYRGWISIENTELNNPIFKSKDNSFYLSHNSQKKKSNNGALCLDYRCSLGDKNAVIYGNSPNNGSLFATLHNYRQASFFRLNSTINLTDGSAAIGYRVFAVMVINSSKSQDGGHIFNIYRNKFWDDIDFAQWIGEARERSLVNSSLDVNINDKLLTLVTQCDDFENARLVVMARAEREEESFDNIEISVNQKPKYPKEWYKKRNIEYPF